MPEFLVLMLSKNNLRQRQGMRRECFCSKKKHHQKPLQIVVTTSPSESREKASKLLRCCVRAERRSHVCDKALLQHAPSRKFCVPLSSEASPRLTGVPQEPSAVLEEPWSSPRSREVLGQGLRCRGGAEAGSATQVG